jgi:hypothetical protein
MTTPLFPTLSGIDYPIKIKDSYFTRINRYGKGESQRLSEMRFPMREVHVPFGKLNVTDRNTLYSFFRARLGASEAFHYFHNRSQKIVDEYVGYATGSEQTLDIPSKSTVSGATLILYADMTPISKTLSAGTGENDSDQVIFTATLGSLITLDCYGLLRLRCVFGDDFEEEWFRYLHSRADIILYEEPVVT